MEVNKFCKRCNSTKNISEYHKNKSTFDGLASYCKKCYNNYSKEYMKKSNYSYQKKYTKKTNRFFQNKNKSQRSKEYYERKKECDLFRLKNSCRSRIWAVLKDGKENKNTENILGISISDYKLYLSRQFQNGMNWDNYGEWHIDHIKPLSLAKTEEELLKLLKYNNTQPLWADENLRKGNKYGK